MGKRARDQGKCTRCLYCHCPTFTDGSALESSLAPSRNKKLRVEYVNDENAAPGPHKAATRIQYGGSYDLDDVEDPLVISKRYSQSSSACQANPRVKRNPKSTSARNADIYTDVIHEDTDWQVPVQVPTPQTPRHRDALSKKIPVTPRRLLTPAGKHASPRTPRTPPTPTSVPSVYDPARQAFVRSADPGRLVGRDSERNQLDAFIRDGINGQSGRCLYISGPPGTGKSALVSEVCQDLPDSPMLRKALINCMSIKASGDVYQTLVNILLEESDVTTSKHDDLYTILAPKAKSLGPVYLIVLDEIDHLLNLDLDVLYKLFELALRQTSRLLLIGIANALDLTDRFLPRLKARNLKPQLLPFLPYSAPQVASVITEKLRTLLPKDGGTRPDYVPFVHPTAIDFCSKKVATQTGDLRKAFDIIHRSLTLLENETKKKHQLGICAPLSPSKSPLSENPNLSSPSKPCTLATFPALITPWTAPRVTIAHIARISASALGYGTSQRLQTLNLQQKAALCALVHLDLKRLPRWRPVTDTPSKSSVKSSPTIRDLYGTYSSLCKRDNALHPLTAVEFCDVVGGLETLGLVGEGETKGVLRSTPGKKLRKREDRRVSCWVSKKELEACLDGAGGGILKGLLTDDE
ncbi:MAG: hypothetical protein L6R35_001871 [Caloplaca aegaea]|nr:MAG: hypothetical protein L6R35_001871 [Caloplaca aegaea]